MSNWKNKLYVSYCKKVRETLNVRIIQRESVDEFASMKTTSPHIKWSLNPTHRTPNNLCHTFCIHMFKTYLTTHNTHLFIIDNNSTYQKCCFKFQRRYYKIYHFEILVKQNLFLTFQTQQKKKYFLFSFKFRAKKNLYG